MSRDHKKFVNPKFTRTIDLGLLRRLLERHAAELPHFDFSVFGKDDAEARKFVEGYFAGPDENYSEGLIADLHHIAELGTAAGLEVLLQQALRFGANLLPAEGEGDRAQDPKHIAVKAFLDHREVFDAASDMMVILARPSLDEFVGLDEGVEARMDDIVRQAFEAAAAELFKKGLRSNHCRVGWYDDDEFSLVITHGSPVTTASIVDGQQEKVISFRTAEHAVLKYQSGTGIVGIGGTAKALRRELAEIFADKVLGRPGFFASDHAQNLYTLDRVQQVGFGFRFTHEFDDFIQRVQITEVQVDRVGADAKTGETRTFFSYVARDGRDNALARLGEMMRGASLGADWRLNHLVFRVHFGKPGTRTKKVVVKLKPPAHAVFKRIHYEDRILRLLRRNGMLHDRDASGSAVAAE